MENGVNSSVPNSTNTNNVQVVMTERRSNGMGTAGFVLALLGLLLCWVPFVNWVLWILGLIFSFVGIFMAPRGLAIAGLVLSLIGLIIIIAVLGALASAL